MSQTTISFFPHWPYDQALDWMRDAHDQVMHDRHKLFIGCGSHAERVITLGRRCNNVDDDLLQKLSANSLVRRIDRGGGMTAHEPGQIVLYPVFDLKVFRIAVKNLVDIMENAMLNFLRELNINAQRSPLGPGVFVDDKKLGFIGFRVAHGITKHGMALNVLNDGEIFSAFDPCGIKALKVSSAKNHQVLSSPMTSYFESFAHHFHAALFPARRANDDGN